MEKRTIYIIIGLVGACVLCGCIGSIALGAVGGLTAIGLTGPVADVGDSFMGALRDGDYNRAYALCAPSLQSELGSAEGLQSLIETGNAIPSSWSFSSRNINGSTGSLNGNITYQSGESGSFDLTLARSNGDWLIIAFDLR